MRMGFWSGLAIGLLAPIAFHYVTGKLPSKKANG